jgi:hypothetical protein
MRWQLETRTGSEELDEGEVLVVDLGHEGLLVEVENVAGEDASDGGKEGDESGKPHCSRMVGERSEEGERERKGDVVVSGDSTTQ